MQLRTSHLIALSMALVFSVSAEASASRTFVATTGNDANTATNCGATTPCRTFGAALSVTNSGGELVVLNSGGYGPATISQPVIITAIGIDASVSQPTSGQNAITTNTSGNVTLIGLNLHGEAAGLNGILINQIGFLRLYNTLIEGFSGAGVFFQGSGKLEISGSTFNDDLVGLYLGNTSAFAYVRNSSFNNNTDGVQIFMGQATIADSSAEYNTLGGFSTNSGSLTLINDRATFNNMGVRLELSAASVYFVNCLIADNTTAYAIATGATMAGTNPGTSFIGPGQSTVGALSAPIALQ